MKIGFIGLGRMGKAMVLRLLEQGVDVVVYNRTAEKTDELVKEYKKSIMYQVSRIKYEKGEKRNTKYVIRNTGLLTASYSISELVKKLEPPRIIWLMVPHGSPVDEMIECLTTPRGWQAEAQAEAMTPPMVKRTEGLLTQGDIIIDGGNSFYKDSRRRYELLQKKGIHFLDVGTSGGLEGARYGACLMVGGDRAVYNRVRPCFGALAGAKGNVAYFGPAGAGHFVKMIHNGVEYGMLQAIGEGFEMLSKGMPTTTPFARAALARRIEIDLHKVAQNWSHGSVVRGWLMELLEKALREEKGKKGDKGDEWLREIEGVVGGGETGEWTVKTAKELKVETPVIEKSLEARKKSIDRPTFSGKVVAALRREFGGHEVKKKK